MPNLYNRPRWTLNRLVSAIRYRTTLPGLFLLIVSSLFLLGGIWIPQEIAQGWSNLQVTSLPWRFRATTLLASPLGRLLEATHWLNPGPQANAAPEAALLLLQALAAGGAVTLTVRFLLQTGLKEVFALQVGLVLAFASCLGGATWNLGPDTLLTLACAGTLLFAWSFRKQGLLRDGLSALACVAAGSLLDPTLLLLLFPLANWGLPEPLRKRHRLCLGLALGLVLAGFWLHGAYLLHPQELHYLLAHLAPGQVLRRLFAALTGTGSSLLLGIPPLVIAILGVPSLVKENRPLARFCLEATCLLGVSRLLLVHDLQAASVPLQAYAPLLPALAPALAHGLIRLQSHARGKLVILVSCLLGTALQFQGMLFDFEFPLRFLESKKMDFPLDRSFTPELSPPILSFQCLSSYLSGDQVMHLWLPKLMGIPGTSPITLDTRSLAPRPWPWRLARWTPAPEQDQPVVLLGNLPLGRRSLWLQITGAAFYLVLLGLGLLGLFALWERNQRLWERIREEERFAHPGEESGPPAAA